ncbi:MAG: hypothetical protein RL094_426 [Candidatus Parcubacteria bacterium]|jgi:methionyl-tRNA formyltransferase
MHTHPSFIFFGTSEFSVVVLNTLKQKGLLPIALVTTPDKPQGRKMVLTPPLTKVWAHEHSIPVHQFEKLNDDAVAELKKIGADLYIVASYGKIIPQKVLDIPAKGALNVHPSLLPLYRGASPLQSSILADDANTGVTIIKMDALMDHGPIVAVKEVAIDPWPIGVLELEQKLATIGGEILADSIPGYIDGSIVPEVQDEARATCTRKITKEDGLISIDESRSPEEQYADFLKVKAFQGWPGTYFFVERHGTKIRVKVIDADFIEGQLVPTRVVPEGKKEMRYEDFILGL